MSTAVATTRPTQALRLRRESQRPSLARSATSKANNAESGVKEDTKRYVTTAQDILAKFKGSQPSLRVYLHANHFRINDSQESVSYASPMKELLEHIRARTVPHNMLDDFYSIGIPFYDNCLIVEVHDHRSGGQETKKDSSASIDGNKIAFSIHNYNSFITPSPHVPYPQKTTAKPNQPEKGSEPKDDKELDKENMPAPGHPASSQKQPGKPKISTAVLFPTSQSHLVDLQLLATTPLPDIQTYRRNQAAGRAAGNPPTPLTAVPHTPTLPTGRSPKRQKMVIDESNVHDFEAQLLEKTCPKLYLEPTKSLFESQAIMEALTHPNNKNPPAPRKTRKRTTAELAADEAEAADLQRFMLAGDEWQATKTATAAGGEDGQPAVRGPNFQTFSRFKTLESIKMHHEEAERRKKEEEALQAQAKRQAQADLEAKKRRDLEASRQAEQSATMMQQQQEQLLRQQQARQQHLQQEQAMRAQSQSQQIANVAGQQTPQSATQPQFSSPVVRQQTPMAAVASPLVPAHTTHPMGGTPMVATSSNHGAGSPARPPSAIAHNPVGMVRSMSQQQSQSLSRTGTPQMVQQTPVMNQAGPARNMAATPQPRMVQGSPTVPMQGGTPIMMGNSQPNSLTPEQMQQLQIQQQNQMKMAQLRQQQSMQQNPQQVAMAKALQQIQQHGVPQGQNPQAYQQLLAQRIFQQMKNHNNNMSPQNPAAMGGQTPGIQNAQGMNMNMGANNAATQLQTMKAQYHNREQQILSGYGALQNAPQPLQQQMNQLKLQIQQRQRGLEQQQMQMTQNMQNMGGAGQNPNPAQMQQYQQALQQQRQHQARQQQLMAMQQRQHGGQMPQGMMGNMGMMNNMNMQNMQNMGGMNMQNMQHMGSMGNMGNMQAVQQAQMAGMNMGQMNQQQQQQMQMMLMRQQMAARAGQGGQQGQGNGMDWSGV
ncbi:hypothetical protein K491DRAFT_654442 [Lophiostoma macrostomum CBS 122681]|uniref:Spt20-like SEP domain-containing protein n=1 Tax=Lophiostoma macrostomum CBS 122681 TaxID=1314788 RepID=A0A6A6TCV9_9PLEO|nr:hypothetical protein K491DRAFT_654442 [Lophiostoma macrostomum CBS 122681]